MIISPQNLAEVQGYLLSCCNEYRERRMNDYKKSSNGLFPLVNYLPEVGRIYINDFNPEFKDLVEPCLESLGIHVKMVDFHPGAPQDGYNPVAVVIFRNNSSEVYSCEQEVVSKLELFCTT